jgi:hydrogenase nickel incorporation protein HypB
MSEKNQRRVRIVEGIHAANEKLADENRRRFDQANLFSMNLMASPGAGKTSLIEQTVQKLSDSHSIAVIDGDIATSIDAERAQAAGAESVQINTGGECHLDAVMLQGALDQLLLDEFDLLLVENVGNLICPASFALGTHQNVLIASVPEGDDKPYKYPGIYAGVEVLVVNKIDLLPFVEFDMEYFQAGVEILNPGLITFKLSCRTGEGLDGWLGWIRTNLERVES